MLGAELLRGQTVRLAPLSKADAPTIAPWYEDAEYMRLLDADAAFPKSAEEVEEFIAELRKNKAHIFALRRVSDDVLMGMGGLDEINWNNGVAWAVLGLGRPYWNQGYGSEAMAMILRYAFDELNLHKVQLTVFGYNARAQAVYVKAGFRQEGVMREFLRRDGQRYDMIMMGILEREWREQQAR
jgi:RimJ/RimL family protein N-acetyltransferase